MNRTAETRQNAFLPHRGSRRLKWCMAGNSTGVSLRASPCRHGWHGLRPNQGAPLGATLRQSRGGGPGSPGSTPLLP